MTRVVIAGVVGGIVVFLWGFIGHAVLPLGETGMHLMALPGETQLLTTLDEALPESRLYFLPGMDSSISDPEAQRKAHEAKLEASPAAFIVYQESPAGAMTAKQLLSEFVSNVFCALLASLILAEVGARYFMKVIIVALLGLFAWLAVDVSHWIWYAFPSDFAMAQGVDHVVGWFTAGLVVAAIVKNRNIAEPARATA